MLYLYTAKYLIIIISFTPYTKTARLDYRLLFVGHDRKHRCYRSALIVYVISSISSPRADATGVSLP